jgi:hypothetical protein
VKEHAQGILRRHLPQLFVRGDNIVLINRSFPEVAISATSNSKEIALQSAAPSHVHVNIMSDEILVDYDESSNF